MNKRKNEPIIELSTVIQGEGSLMGVPHILIRLSGCRLRCQFKDSFCDTWYSSWSPEKGRYSVREVASFLRENIQINHVFITGGGPTIHKKLLPELVDTCKSQGLYVTIETEGSEFVETSADLISLSPKLASSTPIPGTIKPWDGSVVTERDMATHERYRVNYEAMSMFIERQQEEDRDFQLKPVISSLGDLEEIREIQDILGVPNYKVWLMPEGTTPEALQKNREWLFSICTEEGYNYSDRLHIVAYNGEKRGV